MAPKLLNLAGGQPLPRANPTVLDQRSMSEGLPQIRVTEEIINFGAILPEVNAILQRGVSLYRRDPDAADRAFREALSLAPDQLPTYLCLYKIHTYQGSLDEALTVAQAALAEAARQAGLDADWRIWRAEDISGDVNGPAHFALYTMKALAFIHLRRDERRQSRLYLDKLADLGAMDSVGGTVIAALSAGLDNDVTSRRAR